MRVSALSQWWPFVRHGTGPHRKRGADGGLAAVAPAVKGVRGQQVRVRVCFAREPRVLVGKGYVAVAVAVFGPARSIRIRINRAGLALLVRPGHRQLGLGDQGQDVG